MHSSSDPTAGSTQKTNVEDPRKKNGALSSNRDPSRVAPFILKSAEPPRHVYCETGQPCVLGVGGGGGWVGGKAFSEEKPKAKALVGSKSFQTWKTDKVVQTRPFFKRRRQRRRGRKKKKISAWRVLRNTVPLPRATNRLSKTPSPSPLLFAIPANSLLHYLTHEQKIVRNIWKGNNVSLWYEKS